MLAIKLKRVGKKHQASFRIVVGERRSKVNGRFVEELGWFNPRTSEVQVDKERALYWVKSGAQATDSVHNLFVRVGVVKGKKIAVHSISKKKVEAKNADITPAVQAEIKSAESIETETKPAEEKEEILQEVATEAKPVVDEAVKTTNETKPTDEEKHAEEEKK